MRAFAACWSRIAGCSPSSTDPASSALIQLPDFGVEFCIICRRRSGGLLASLFRAAVNVSRASSAGARSREPVLAGSRKSVTFARIAHELWLHPEEARYHVVGVVGLVSGWRESIRAERSSSLQPTGRLQTSCGPSAPEVSAGPTGARAQPGRRVLWILRLKRP